jgi:formiminotetrahydrofolate cyclodeaminase
MTASFLDQPLARFLDLVAAREPAPGGGAVSAVTVAAAASLTAMAARFSGSQIPDSAEIAEQADELRHRAMRLATDDADAYTAVLAAYALPRAPDPARRTAQIRQALRQAAEVPADLAGVAAQVALLGLRVAKEGNPNLKGDAVTAILLADAAARAAAGLVELNAGLGKLGPDLPDRASARVIISERRWLRSRERSLLTETNVPGGMGWIGVIIAIGSDVCGRGFPGL